MIALKGLVIISSIHISLTHPTTPGGCEIHAVGGFLQNVCATPPDGNNGYEWDKTIYKCINTDQFYKVGWKFVGRNPIKTVDVICDNDYNFYQACSTVGENEVLYRFRNMKSYSAIYPCGYLCNNEEMGLILNVPDVGIQTGELVHQFTLFYSRIVCNGEDNCLNTDLDESLCKSDKDNQAECDMACDLFPDCEDESFCNGYEYGIWCDDNQLYVRPRSICDGFNECADGADERNCKVSDEIKTICTMIENSTISPLFNFTRCGPLVENFQSYGELEPVCTNYMDQTNCSDVSRVGLHCKVHGFMSTVSRQIICINSSNIRSQPTSIPAVCDDSLDKECVEVSLTCFLHKHQLCDEVNDCQDRTDETQVLCQRMTTGECTRRFVSNTTVRSIPTVWVNDGLKDCLEGEDETDVWPTCGREFTSRPKDRSDDSCTEVFLCLGMEEFVEFPKLCDRVNTCGNENLICQQSRFQVTTFNIADRDREDRVKLAFCQKGLQNIGHLMEVKCVDKKFIFSKKWVFGRNDSLKVTLPDTKTDCRHFYGEMYVFLSCMRKCKASRCPLPKDTQVKFNSCPGQFDKAKLFTVDKDGELTFLVKNPRTTLLGNNFFLCQTGQTCLTYDKVCNLVDDCGDGSDEASCDNHFQCESSKEYLHVAQQCDSVFHCADRSDECNEACGGTYIIRDTWLKVAAWVIGLSAFLLNAIGVVKNISSLSTCKTEAALLTNCMVILISLGDFLVGTYLTVLASFDAYHGAEHCKVQLEWITGHVCVALGISSTFGSQISLLSMVVLSVIRAVGIRSDIKIPREKTRGSTLKATFLIFSIVLIGALASCFPMLPSFEDYFVNGIRYENSNTLFVGCPDKKKHMAVIEQYYGRIRLDGEMLAWSQIKPLVADMFSTDYGGIKQTTLSFYGNDPVCVFKYFVRVEDPQRNYSVALLILNVLCFVTMTASYSAIAIVARKTTGAVNKASPEDKINTEAKKNDERLRRVINAIITTDFLCWMPFTLVCFLHLTNVTDATPWYPFFSILVLPINSVINPLLYNKVVTRALDGVFVKCTTKVFYFVNRLINLLHFKSSQKEGQKENGGMPLGAEGQNKNNSGVTAALNVSKNCQ